MNRHHPRYSISAVVETVDTDWTLFDFTVDGDVSDSFPNLVRLHSIRFSITSDSKPLSSCTVCLTEDQAGAVPITNPGVNATQTAGESPAGTTEALVFSLGSVYVYTSTGNIYVWLKVNDALESLTDVQATLAWED